MNENFENKDRPGYKGDVKMDRREFFKQAGLIAGSAAVGVGLGIGLEKDKEIQREVAKEHERKGEGVIVEKVHIPTVGFPIMQIERWEVRIKIGEREEVFLATEEEFNSYGVGEKIAVIYDDRDASITSIKKITQDDKK